MGQMGVWERIRDSVLVLCSLFQGSVSPPTPSPNQSYQGSSGYNFRPTDARCLPRSVLLHPPTRYAPLVVYIFWTSSPRILFPLLFPWLPTSSPCLRKTSRTNV